jgi:hypothetical protein
MHGLIQSIPNWVASALVVLLPVRAADPLPKTHPIYQMPDLTPLGQQPVNKVQHVVLPITPPRWAFTVDKKKFLLGETITGRLTLENTDKKAALRLSPPYRGFQVATIGVWVSRWQADGKWSTLTPVAPVNRGRFSRFGAKQFQGEPVILKPGGRWEAAMAVGGEALLLDRGALREAELAPFWIGGFGFREPGQYRFYLQYVNLEEYRPFGVERRTAAHRPAYVKEGPDNREERDIPRDVPPEPVVLGPYDIEVLPLDGEVDDEGVQKFVRLLAEWEKTSKRHVDVDDLVLSASSFSLAPLAELFETGTLKSPAAAPVRDSLALSQAQGQLFKLPADPAEKLKVQQDVLQRLQDARKRLPAGPLRDAYGLTECYLLLDLDRRAEALALARALQTPDARVFLADQGQERP